MNCFNMAANSDLVVEDDCSKSNMGDGEIRYEKLDKYLLQI